MEWHTWWTFFAACWLIALSPGSGAVLSVSHGLTYGVRGASATIAGLQVGLAGITLVAGVGVGAVLVASATAFTVVKLAGAAYLMFLGWRQWNAPVQPGQGLLAAAEAAPAQRPDGATSPAAPDAHATRPTAGVLGWRQRFSVGVFTNLTNPKGIVFMVAVLPQFIAPDRPLAPQLGLLMLTMAVVDTLVMHGYAYTGARLARWLRGERAQRLQNRLFGGVLMAMGASLMWVRRSAA